MSERYRLFAGLAVAATLIVSATGIAPAPLLTAAEQTRQIFTPHSGRIEVRDSAGNVMIAPFLGGLDIPRPSLVDMNGDGRLDLFIQERSGELIHFERSGDTWEWKSDRFQNIDIGEWYRFSDIDGDGDIDLLSEMIAGYMRVWRNTGTRTAPRFEALGDTVRDVDGLPLPVDRQNILNAVDIDCNGKLDLFVGRVQGYVDRFEQEGVSPDGSPRFRLMEEFWQGIEVIGPEAPGMMPGRVDTMRVRGPMVRDSVRLHGANTLAFADVDGRGVLDLFWGDFFEQGLLRFENHGSCTQPDLTGAPHRFPAENPLLTSGYNAPTFGDVDGDGLVDMVLGVIGGAYGPSRTSVRNLFFVRQAPKGTWTVVTERMVTSVDVGSEAIPAFADIDGDSLPDLIIGARISPDDGNTGTLTWFRNTGSRTSPSFREMGQLPIRGDFNYAPTFHDIDGDGSADMILGGWSDRVRWYKQSNTGSARSWTLADSALVTITRGTNTVPAVGDIDDDGLPDLVIGESSGTINVYRHTGSRTSPKFELVSDQFQDIRVGRRSTPLLVDMDGDRRLDLLIGNEAGEIRLWRRSAGREIRFEQDSTFLLETLPFAAAAVGDLHGDGRTDLIIGNGSGGLRWFRGDLRRQ